MKWTSKKPQFPGWYWWRRKNYKTHEQLCLEIVKIRLSDGLHVNGWGRLDRLDGQWAGPLEPPEEKP